MSKKGEKSRRNGAPPILAERCRSLPNSIVLHAAPESSTKLIRAQPSTFELNPDKPRFAELSWFIKFCRALPSYYKLYQTKAIMNTEASRPFDPQYSPS